MSEYRLSLIREDTNRLRLFKDHKLEDPNFDKVGKISFPIIKDREVLIEFGTPENRSRGNVSRGQTGGSRGTTSEGGESRYSLAIGRERKGTGKSGGGSPGRNKGRRREKSKVNKIGGGEDGEREGRRERRDGHHFKRTCN